MSHEEIPYSKSHSTDGNPVNGPGQRLRIAREQQKLSVDYVAEKIRLRPKQVLALEMDDYSYAPPAYARGHLCLYARLMGVPINEVLKAFDALGFSLKEPPPLGLPDVLDNPQKLTTRHEKFPSMLRWLTYGVICLVILGIAFWWFHHRQETLKVIGQEDFNARQITSKSDRIPLVIPPMQQATAVRRGPVAPRVKERMPRDDNSQE
jgi:cytoskeleton protein RodZ